MTNPPYTPDDDGGEPNPATPPAPQPPYGHVPPYGQVPPAPQYGQLPPQQPYTQLPPSPQYGQPPYGQVPPAPQYGGQPPYGQVQPFTPVPVSIGEAFRFAWAAFKLDPMPWIVATLVMFIVSGIGQGIANSMRRTTEWMDYTITFTTPGAWAVSLIFTIIGLSLIHISEPTRLGMISYAVFCLKKKK